MISKRVIGIAVVGLVSLVAWIVHRNEAGRSVQPAESSTLPARQFPAIGADGPHSEAVPHGKDDDHDFAERSRDPDSRRELPSPALQEATVENRWLLDAGFSQERIDWFVRRKKELLAQRQQETEQRKLAGALPDPSGGAWMLDNDLLLRDEMDNEEYVKYRQALRKTTAVGVDNVVQGSNASNAGLLPGDQIVRYDGKRVFSDLELRSLARSTNGNQIAQVEVLRDGRSLTMVMPGGEIGIARTAESRLSDITRRAIAVAREGRSSPGANQ